MTQFRRAGALLPGYALAAATVLMAALACPAHALATTALATTAPAASTVLSRPVLSRPVLRHGGMAPAVPATASGCNTASLDQWHNCTTVTGSGLKITSISGYGVSEVDGALSDLHVEIYGPAGLIKNCGTFSLPGMGDTGPICSWTNPSPKTNETPGDYCTITWQYQGGTSYESGGAECVGVHS